MTFAEANQIMKKGGYCYSLELGIIANHVILQTIGGVNNDFYYKILPFGDNPNNTMGYICTPTELEKAANDWQEYKWEGENA